MKIGILANPAFLETTGVGRFSKKLIESLIDSDKENNYILIGHFIKNIRQRLADLKKLSKYHNNKNTRPYFSVIPAFLRDFMAGINFPMNILYPKMDIYFSLFPSGMVSNGFKKQLTVVHDLVCAKFPEHQGLKFSHYLYERTRLAANKSNKIIAISESTKRDLIKEYKIEEEKIKVVYLGIDHSFFNPKNDTASIFKKYGIKKNFILSVCTLEPRKNLSSLIDAYLSLPDHLKNDFQLVLVGQNGWNNADLEEKISSEEKKTDRIIRTGYVKDDELPYFYSAAQVFVYPSLYEGFGLPPLEAMACGCPVITSNNSSLPEVVGGAGVLVDPKNVKMLSQAIAQVLTDVNYHNFLRDKGIKQAKKFNWDKTAKQVIEIYKEL